MRLDLIWQIARKELLLFFASPIAYLVLGAFLAITLFVFFSCLGSFAGLIFYCSDNRLPENAFSTGTQPFVKAGTTY